MSKITLYGAAVSFYTGRARSYLIKAGLDYREIPPNTLHYRDNVLPKAGGRRGIPTLETEHYASFVDKPCRINSGPASKSETF